MIKKLKNEIYKENGRKGLDLVGNVQAISRCPHKDELI